MTVTVTPVDPAGTDTIGSVTSFGLLVVRFIAAPPDGAGPFRVTVSELLLPPTTLVGLKPSVDSVAPFMVSVADLVTVP